MNVTSGSQSLIDDPVFALIWTSLASGVFGFLLKALIDFWTAKAKQRQEFATHVINQIEKNVPTYFLMSNYATEFSDSLERYIELKQEWLLEPIDPENPNQIYNLINDLAEETSKEALFHGGYLLRIMTDLFQEKGADYFLPDRWAATAMKELHKSLTNMLRFDPDILLKHVETSTRKAEFLLKLQNEELEDLREEYSKYKQWLLREERQLREVTAYAAAYSDLFQEQMVRLYKDYHQTGVIRKEVITDPLVGKEIKGKSRETIRKRQQKSRWRKIFNNSPLALSDPTIELIKRSMTRSYDYENRHSKEISRVIQPGPGDVDVNMHLNLGWNYYITNHFDHAIIEYKEAKKIRPDNAIIHNNLGNTYSILAFQGRAKYQDSINEYIEAIKLEPDNPVFNANFGRMWYSCKKYDKTIEYYEKAIELHRNNPSDIRLGSDYYTNTLSFYYNMLGNAYFSLNDIDKAIDCFGQAVSLNPINLIILSNLALSYIQKSIQSRGEEKRRRHSLAKEIYQRALTLTGDNIEEFRLLGRQLAQIIPNAEGEYLEDYLVLAKQIYLSAVKLRRAEPTDYRSLAQIHTRLGEWEEAIIAYYIVLERDEKNSRDAHELIKLHLQSNRGITEQVYNRAKSVCKRAIEDQPEQAENYFLLGKIYSYVGDFERAIDQFNMALKLDPNNHNYYNEVGVTYRRLEHYTMAIHCYDKAIIYYRNYLTQNNIPENPTDINFSTYYYNMGSVYQHLGLFEKAIPILKNIIDHDPTDFDALLSLAEMFRAKKDIKNALKYCELALRAKGDIFDAYLLYGHILLDDKNYSDAIRAFEDAYLLNPSNDYDDILISLIEAYWKAFESEPTLDLAFGLGLAFERAENNKKVTRAVRYRFNLLKINLSFYKQRYYKESLRMWDRSSPEQLDSQKLFSTHINLGTACDGINDLDGAIKHYLEAESIEPDSYVVHYNLGSIYLRQGNYDGALVEFQESYRLKPEFPHTSYNIGICFYMRQAYHDISKEKWEEAIGLSPRLAQGYYNLGVLFHNDGDETMAKSYFEHAIEFDSSIVEADYNLGVILYKDNVEEAIEHWDRCLSIPIALENIQKIRGNQTPSLALLDIANILVLHI